MCILLIGSSKWITVGKQCIPIQFNYKVWAKYNIQMVSRKVQILPQS